MRVSVVYDSFFGFNVITSDKNITKLFVTLEFPVTTRELRKIQDPTNIQFPRLTSKSYEEPPIAGQVKEKDVYKTIYDCSNAFGEFAISWPVVDKIIIVCLDKLKIIIKGDNMFTLEI